MLRRILAICLLLGPVAATAHHNGYACLLRGTSLFIEGDVQEYVFTMPHVVIRLKLADGTVYTAEWMTAQQMQGMFGVTARTLKNGDHLVIKGTPFGCEKSKMSLLAHVRRPADGWEWQSPIYQ